MIDHLVLQIHAAYGYASGWHRRAHGCAGRHGDFGDANYSSGMLLL
jgi:hypothetical protein